MVNSNPYIWGLLFTLLTVMGPNSAQGESAAYAQAPKAVQLTIKIEKNNDNLGFVFPTDYENRIGSLEHGDTAEFADGARFAVGRRLGSGVHNLILEVLDKPGSVLRLANEKSTWSYLDEISYGARELNDFGVPHAKVFNFAPGQYVEMERIAVDLTLSDFLYAGFDWRHKPISPQIRKRLGRDLIEFSKKAFMFTDFGDMHEGQLVYEKERGRWVLIDWRQDHQNWDPNPKPRKNEKLPEPGFVLENELGLAVSHWANHKGRRSVRYLELNSLFENIKRVVWAERKKSKRDLRACGKLLN